MNVSICTIGCHPHPGRIRETRQIVISTTHEDADAPESTQTADTRVEHPTGVVRPGNIIPLTLEEEAISGLVNTRDGDLNSKTFADFGVNDPVVDTLGGQGIAYPSPVRALTLPPTLERHDIIGQAKTGTGKTLDLTIPVLEDVIALDENGYGELLNPGHPQALIILLIHEPAKQVAADLRNAAKYLSTCIVDIYGGVTSELQIEALERGTDIAVDTPGRLIGLLREGVLHLNGVKTIVLNEADKVFDLSFLPDVEALLSRVPSYRHTMLFSVTVPGSVVTLVRKSMEHPARIRVQNLEDQNQTVSSVKQVIYRVHTMSRIEVVACVLQPEGRGRSVIFYRTKCTAAYPGEGLSARSFVVGSLHSDLGQGARGQALRTFRKDKVDVFAAVDIAACSTDVDDVTHVINYQCPEDERIHIHRIGHTGRVGSSGVTVTFVD